MAVIDDRTLLRRIADKTIAEKYTVEHVDYRFFENIPGKGARVTDDYTRLAAGYGNLDMMYNAFDWHNGVGCYGLLEAAAALNEPKYREFVEDYIAFHLTRGLPQPNINTTAPMISMFMLADSHPEYDTPMKQRAHFLMAQAPRTVQGAFEHTVIGLTYGNEGQLWADTLFMGCLFLAGYAKHTGCDMYLHEAGRQLMLHYEYLTDHEIGIMFHAYGSLQNDHMSAVHWGRANGWTLMAAIDIIAIMPELFACRSILVDRWHAHLSAILRYQGDDGGFNTVLDDPTSYRETTIACGVCYAMAKAKRIGVLDDSMDQALISCAQHIRNQVGTDGQMLRTSGGTPVMASRQEYNKIPFTFSYYGQGLGLLAFAELSRTR